jgi:hypothetical protein
MAMEKVKVENEFTRFKSMHDITRAEVTNLYKKDELVVNQFSLLYTFLG